MRSRMLAGLSAAALVALSGFGAARADEASGQGAATPERSGINATATAVSAYAWIQPQDGVLVVAGPANEAGYRIAGLDVAEGDMVEAGQPLAELGVKSERAASLAIAQAQVKEAQVNADFARLDQARKEKLANGSPAAVSLQDLDAAHQAAQLAEVRLEIARRQQDYAEVMLDKATIAAPVAGMVLRILKHAGEGFVPGQGLIELGRVDHMQAVAEVYDSDVRFVAPGQRATFKSPALAKPAKGKVLRVQPLLDPVKLYETNAGASVENRVVHVIVDFGADPALTRMTGLQGIVSIDTAPVSGN